jgi:hypothetical protein
MPFKCSLLDTSGTSPSSTSATSFLNAPQSNGSLRLLRRRWIELGDEAPWVPPRQKEQGEGPRLVDARRRRPPTHRGAEAGRGESRCPGDLQCLDPLGSSARRRSECAIAGGGGAGSPHLGEH